ncbi:hypothetical protein UFOVP1078_10 [uncultured Caudovirales phage]|uniref:Uncharacterized protein n=1 Tax=uncultured Caudovirales phage TaxID=2100421 RepID=A0A6J5LQY9_9CAUD|nr:hypothetical protein UFOVP289_21 [uncultured Caudovirales phage]CAB4150025.1 hypothetical protein UFOVP547_26 [uncultured Caudovirales phage]CAB4170052.1 hypothetical protein UFOVP900_43 [uncultured Caudovirales phage]CAB4182538.1 hypothetical protein UFOVP1078_10 [uncultured Caudovirales phage]CAB4198281.1 hypothetical protein UFOVP1317_63 [uncultured Caudovirales phage]
METQSLINIVIGIAAFFGGWTINSITRSIEKIEDKLNAVPIIYVSKDDYKEDLKRIYDMLDKIFGKLDDKADK